MPRIKLFQRVLLLYYFLYKQTLKYYVGHKSHPNCSFPAVLQLQNFPIFGLGRNQCLIPEAWHYFLQCLHLFSPFQQLRTFICHFTVHSCWYACYSTYFNITFWWNLINNCEGLSGLYNVYTIHSTPWIWHLDTIKRRSESIKWAKSKYINHETRCDCQNLNPFHFGQIKYLLKM